MASTTWLTAPREVITKGTRCFMHSFTSASKRGLVGWTIRLTPKGAGCFPVSRSNWSNSVFICTNQASKPSLLRWFRAGKVPTMPFLQQATTSSGPEIRNIGAATTGRERPWMKFASLLMGRDGLTLKIGLNAVPPWGLLSKLWYFYRYYACITKSYAMYLKEFEIRWSDLDANRHMANSAYINFMSHTRMAYLLELGLSQGQMAKEGLGPVVFYEHIHFFREAFAGQPVRVSL